MAQVREMYYQGSKGATRGIAFDVPVSTISFLEVLFGAMYSIALPNILIFKLHYTVLYIGLIDAINSIAYMIGPAVFNRFVSKAGPKKVLVTIIVVTSMYSLVTAFTLAPIVLLVAYVIDGMLASTFWAAMDVAVAAIQSSLPEGEKDKAFRVYGLSWNVGAIAGELFGAGLVAQGFSNYAIMLLSIEFAMIEIPLAIAVTIPVMEKLGQRKGGKEAKDRVEGSFNQRTKPLESSRPMPIIMTSMAFVIVGELVYQVMKGTYNFYFPFILYGAGASSAWVYYASLFQQVAQVLAVWWSSHAAAGGRYRAAVAGIGASLLFTFLVVVFPTIGMVLAGVVFVGFTAGLIYGFTARVVLDRVASDRSSKHAAVYESASGAGYAGMQVLSALVGQTDHAAAFLLLVVFMALALMYFITGTFQPAMHSQSPEKHESFRSGRVALPRVAAIMAATGAAYHSHPLAPDQRRPDWGLEMDYPWSKRPHGTFAGGMALTRL